MDAVSPVPPVVAPWVAPVRRAGQVTRAIRPRGAFDALRAWCAIRRPLALALVALLLLAASARAQDLPALTQPVNDFAEVIPPANAAEMDRMIRALQQATGDTLVVVTVPTFAPYGDIREYAVKLFENQGRGIGEKGKDNGALVLLAVKDHRVWVEVGYGLEQWITDGFAGETSREVMIPAFRRDDYGGGLQAGVAQLVGRIADGRGVKLEGVEPVRRVRHPRAARQAAPAIILFAIILLVVLSQLGGRGGGGFTGRRRSWGSSGWSGWNSGIGSFGGGGSGGFGGGFGGFGGGRSGGGGGGGGW